jgi:hypothetical protein
MACLFFARSFVLFFVLLADGPCPVQATCSKHAFVRKDYIFEVYLHTFSSLLSIPISTHSLLSYFQKMVRISNITLTSALAAASLIPSTVTAFSRATKGAGLLNSPYDAYLQSHKKRFERRVRHCKDSENVTTSMAEPTIAANPAAPTTLPLFAVASTTTLETTVDEYITVTVPPAATPVASSAKMSEDDTAPAKKNETIAKASRSYKCPPGSKFAMLEDDFVRCLYSLHKSYETYLSI